VNREGGAPPRGPKQWKLACEVYHEVIRRKGGLQLGSKEIDWVGSAITPGQWAMDWTHFLKRWLFAKGCTRDGTKNLNNLNSIYLQSTTVTAVFPLPFAHKGMPWKMKYRNKKRNPTRNHETIVVGLFSFEILKRAIKWSCLDSVQDFDLHSDHHFESHLPRNGL